MDNKRQEYRNAILKALNAEDIEDYLNKNPLPEPPNITVDDLLDKIRQGRKGFA